MESRKQKGLKATEKTKEKMFINRNQEDDVDPEELGESSGTIWIKWNHDDQEEQCRSSENMLIRWNYVYQVELC